MDKQRLSKLASLNNEEANKFLLNFAIEKRAEIEKMKNNDEIIDSLDVFNAFFYRTPKVVLSLCEYLLYKAKPIKSKLIHNFYMGESWEKVQSKSLELLKQIRYYELNKTIKIAFDFAVSDDQMVRSTATKLIQDIAEYNHEVLPHVGIKPQLLVFDYIKKYSLKKDFEKEFNIIRVSLDKILETSSGTAFMSSPDTVTFRKGDLIGNDNVATLRKKTIDLIFLLYKKSNAVSTKSTIAHLLEQASRFPDNSPRESEIFHIVEKNREYIVSELDKIIFNKKGEIQAPLSFCMEIENYLHWFFIFHKLQYDIAQPLYSKLKENPLYKKFSKFVHDDSFKYDGDFNKLENQNRLQVQEYIKNVNVDNIREVENELNSFAKEIDVIGEWKFRNLQALLEKLSEIKPELGFEIIKDAVKEKSPLSNATFLGFLMRGLRLSESYEQWDDAVLIVAKSKNVNILRSIPASLHIYVEVPTDPVLRDKDLDVLNALVKRADIFAFLENKKPIVSLSFSTMNALRAVYSLNPQKIENLIAIEINNNAEYTRGYLDTLAMFTGKEEGIDFEMWSDKNKKIIAEKIIDLPALDWHIEALIYNIFPDPVKIIEIFIKRMKREKKTDTHRFDRAQRYEAIPFQMNDHLIQHVVKHRDYEKIIPEIIKVSDSGSILKYDLSKIIKHFQVSPYLILEALSKGKKITDAILKKVIKLVYDFDGIDIELAITLAGYTSNIAILRDISARLHSTGVVSGEYGLANAYRSKIVELEKYKDNDNENVRKFVEMSIASLEISEKSAIKDSDQNKEKRRIDFEINSQE